MRSLKLNILVATVFLLCHIPVSAQTETGSNDNFELSDLVVSSGEGALSSGIFASLTLKNSDTKLIFEVCQSFVQAMYGKQVGDFFLAGSGGYFNNTPWVGPYVIYSPSDWFTFTTWEGISAGKDGDPDIKRPQFYFAYNNIKLSYGILYLQHSVIHFQTDVPNNIPGIGLSIPLGKFKVGVGYDHSLRDDKPLFSGFVYIPL